MWFGMGWKDRIAAGFTNSASMNGDKHSTLHHLFTLAQPHGMIWVGTGMLPSSAKAADRHDLNDLGSCAGAAAQRVSDSAVTEILDGDLEAARQFGARVAEVALRFNK